MKPVQGSTRQAIIDPLTLQVQTQRGVGEALEWSKDRMVWLGDQIRPRDFKLERNVSLTEATGTGRGLQPVFGIFCLQGL